MAPPTPSFIVPYWLKAAFTVMALFLMGALLLQQIYKRKAYERLALQYALLPIMVNPQPAPDFNLPAGSSAESLFSLSSFKPRWVLLHFWATWCPPCKDEMPSLELLHRQMADKLVILAVSTDKQWEEVEKFFQHQAPSFMVLWDKDQKVANQYQTRRFPETFLISPNQQLVAKFAGPRDWHSPEAIQYLSSLMKTKIGTHGDL